MEATGAYHSPVLSVLKQVGLFVSVINPLEMKKYASKSIRKGKTDKMNSIRIANYGIDNWFHLEDYVPSEKVYNELKMLGRQYSHYITVKITCKLTLISLLDRTMPGIKNLVVSRHTEKHVKDKLGDFAEEYWHYDNITKKSEARFISDYCRWAKKQGYQANQDKAKAIYAMARNGIPTLSSNAPSTKMLTLEAVRVLK